ncbi:helix-turn-helix transcriptional regulator [Bacillus sp. FJAT-45350]|uniref:helix-turn-helix transcriptional regulator n=1 Tax=Bacillus sp. FJAT-45350 TaxID=2011014 RepID=UPI000BB6FF53|nr:helix-turn-helix transcriptional regulator [Bacillus sp. FJAT-45350]
MSDYAYADIVGKNHVNKVRSEGKIAALIKKRRQELNLTQQQFADLIGKRKSTIGRIEASITIPRLDTLFDISLI